MNGSIIWYPLLYRTTSIFSKSGDWKLGHMSFLPVVAPNTHNDENIVTDLSESIPIGLDKWLFCFLTFLASSLHHPTSFFKEESICNAEVLRYCLRTEVQPGSHRLAELWPFCLKAQFPASFYLSRFKYEAKSLNTQHFHSYCSSKKCFVFGSKWPWPSNSWPEPLCESFYWAIVPIRIYTYCTVRYTEKRDNRQHVLKRVLHIDARLCRNKIKVLTKMTSRKHKYVILYTYITVNVVIKMNVSRPTPWNLFSSLRAFFQKWLK